MSNYKFSDVITGEFYYRAEDDTIEKCCPFEYKNSYFDHPTDHPDFDLLRFSLKLAMSASRRKDILYFYDKIGYKYLAYKDYEKENKNVLAGDKITDSVYYPAQTINGVNYINSIAYAIGSKKAEDKTIILVTVRGGDYGIEWGGNFNFGTGIDHEGFKIASDQILEGIKNFLLNINGPVRLHLCGYSRGAAVANLTAARIDQGEIEGLTKDNVSCYTFEAPRNTRSSEAFDERYDNIFNIINPSDFIPEIPFSAWGYKRYGRELNLPSYQTDKDFIPKFESMKRMMLKRLKTVYDLSFNDTYTIDKFADDLAYLMVSPEVYVEKYQKLLEKIFMNFETGKSVLTKEELILFKEFISVLFKVDPINLKRIRPLFKMKTDKIEFNFSTPLLSNHKMGTELSWIESFSGLSDFGLGGYLIASFNDPKEIKIASEERDLLDYIDGKAKREPRELWNGKNQNEQLIVILDNDRPYDLTFKIDNKDLNYSIYHYDQKLGLRDKALIYKPDLRTDHTFKSFIKKPFEDCILTENDNLIKPTDTLIKYLPKFVVRSITEGSGQIIGGGYFYPGMICRLEAKEKDSKFEGWYIKDRKISEDRIYIFNPTEDTEILAKFSDKTQD